jgi:hypothetical protein
MTPQLRDWCPADAQLIRALDANAFGAARDKLVALLAQQNRSTLLFETAPGVIVGYGCIRPGSRAAYLGPIVAQSATAGIALVEDLLATCPDKPIFWDIPDTNTPAVEWAQQHGFTRQRQLTRMYFGENLSPGNPLQQYALAGPEVG